MTATTTALAPQTWPADPVDPARCWVGFDPPADELLVYFGGSPVPAYVSPLDGPGPVPVALLVDESTSAVVGVQVMPFLAHARHLPPAWPFLVHEDGVARRDGVAALVAHARGLFERLGTGGRTT